MRSIEVILLGLITVVGGLAEISNGWTLLSIYVIYRPYGTFYSPPLNIAGASWIFLGLASVLLGSVFIIAGAVRVARRMWVWVCGLGTSVALIILSVAQAMGYSVNASFSGEASTGAVGIIGGVLLILYLLTPRIRRFFQVRPQGR